MCAPWTSRKYIDIGHLFVCICMYPNKPTSACILFWNHVSPLEVCVQVYSWVCVIFRWRGMVQPGGQCVILIKNNHVYLSKELCWLSHKGPSTGPRRETETERRTNISIWLHTCMHIHTHALFLSACLSLSHTQTHIHAYIHVQVKVKWVPKNIHERTMPNDRWMGSNWSALGTFLSTGLLWPLCSVILSPGEIIKHHAVSPFLTSSSFSVWLNMLWSEMVQYNAALSNLIQFHSAQFNSVQLNSIQFFSPVY